MCIYWLVVFLISPSYLAVDARRASVLHWKKQGWGNYDIAGMAFFLSFSSSISFFF
jgi:hypothetical protein